MNLYLGIDLGTSGCRALAIDVQGSVHGQAAVALPAPERHGAGVEQNPELWWQAVRLALKKLFQQIPAQSVIAIAVDGTSGTLLLTDESGLPLGPALMYNDARALAEAARIALVAPEASAAHGTSGALAKLLYLQNQAVQGACHALSQADWISAQFSGSYGISDEHNSLKLGFDPIERRWPEWLERLGVEHSLLPVVVPAGTPIAVIDPAIAAEFGLEPATLIVAGTTDSTAAFLATGACAVGDAVTSLGSTLVMKVISKYPLFAPRFGVYSHRVGDLWLVGGGSNSGGAVLRDYFTVEEMAGMTPQLRPDHLTGLDYYPLSAPGERFPLNEPAFQPRLKPRPASDIEFFQGLLEGMAQIEKQAYELLANLGAAYPRGVYSTGGGAANAAWTQIRARQLGVPMLEAAHQEAACGAALLARSGAERYLSG